MTLHTRHLLLEHLFSSSPYDLQMYFLSYDACLKEGLLLSIEFQLRKGLCNLLTANRNHSDCYINYNKNPLVEYVQILAPNLQILAPCWTYLTAGNHSFETLWVVLSSVIVGLASHPKFSFFFLFYFTLCSYFDKTARIYLFFPFKNLCHHTGKSMRWYDEDG